MFQFEDVQQSEKKEEQNPEEEEEAVEDVRNMYDMNFETFPNPEGSKTSVSVWKYVQRKRAAVALPLNPTQSQREAFARFME